MDVEMLAHRFGEMRIEAPSAHAPLSISFRSASMADRAEIEALHLDWFPLRYAKTFYDDVVGAKRYQSVVAVDDADGTIAGLLVAEMVIESKADVEDSDLLETRMFEDQHMLYILTLGTRQSYRRRGVASALIRHMFEYVKHVRQPLCRCIFLHVLAQNDPARRFYEKHGFRKHTKLTGYYVFDGHTEDAYTYVAYVNGGRPPWKSMRDALLWCGAVANDMYRCVLGGDWNP